MEEGIRYWRGQSVTKLSGDELRTALAEVYRQLEQAQWEIQMLARKIPKRLRENKVVANDEAEEELAA